MGNSASEKLQSLGSPSSKTRRNSSKILWLIRTSSPSRARKAMSYVTRKAKKFWAYIPIPTDVPNARTKFQWFTSNPPLSPFKKLIVSTPRLLRSLYTMSLAKALPDGLKDHECEKSALCKRPPIPYVPEKDCVQEAVSAYKDNHVKTQIGKGMELRVPIWNSGTCKAFLIHVGSA
jgi:hypothetical protein